MVHNYNEAQTDMNKVAEMDPSLSTTAANFVAAVKQIQSQNDQKDRSIFRNMIRSSPSTASTKPSSNDSNNLSVSNKLSSVGLLKTCNETETQQTDKSNSQT